MLNREIVQRMYDGFNRRDIPAVLAYLADNVQWANGMDGGHVHGREAVREYWTKQWAAIQSQVHPLQITERGDGIVAVEVHQIVHDLDGKLLLDETVRHVFRIEEGLVTRFDIEKAGGLSTINRRPLRYTINVTLDGCCDHRAMATDEELHRHAAKSLEEVDTVLLGRVTYQMMEAGFRRPAQPGTRPDWMDPFARAINAVKKYVVSNTLDRVDWNAELVRGDLAKAVEQLKQQSGKRLEVWGVTLPLALAELGLVDEYEFTVQPRIAGRGPTLFAGLSKPVDLKLVSRREFGSGAVEMRYEARR